MRICIAAVLSALACFAACASGGKRPRLDIEEVTRKVVAMETGKALARQAVTREELSRMVAEVPSRPRPDVRRLPPTGRRSSWVEDGHLVLDGRPIIRRNMYAPGYMCSKAFLDWPKRRWPKRLRRPLMPNSAEFSLPWI